MLLRSAIIAILCAASPAHAFDTSKLGQGGSLPPIDLAPLIGQSQQLKREVSDALAGNKQKTDDVICTGNRFPNQWVHLGGLRAAPYTCDFKARWLLFDAAVRVTGRNGQLHDTITPAAMRIAAKVAETKPSWKWTTEDPDADTK